MSLGTEGAPGPPPADSLRLRGDVRGPCLVVEVEGELTIVTSGLLRDRVLAGMRDLGGAPRVVLDVGEVGFCDSSGLNALIVLWKAAHRADGRFALARPDRRFRTIIERSGLDRHLISYPTADEAVEALTPR